MAARQGAQRIAEAQRNPPVDPVAEQISWGELGCPTEIGIYRAGGGQGYVDVRVKRIHIIVAENDPAALFTVLTLRPPLGPPEHILGHRVA